MRLHTYNDVVVPNSWVVGALKPSTTYFVKGRIKVITGPGEGYSNLFSSTKKLSLYSAAGSPQIVLWSSGALLGAGEYVDINTTIITPATIQDAEANYRILGFSERWLDGEGRADYALVEFIDLMLSEEDIPYEPFVPNSPSPDYPSEITSIEEVNLTVSGKNLFDKATNYFVSGSLSNSTGTPVVDNTRARTPNKIPVMPSTKYIISISEPYIPLYGFEFRQDGTFIKRTDLISGRITTSSECSFLVFTLYKTGGANMTTADLEAATNSAQLELGDTATEYEPYIGGSINLPYTLRSLPNGVKDELVIDNVAKTAKIIRRVKELIFNGTENIQSISGSYRYSTGQNVDTPAQITCLSTHFTAYSWNKLHTNSNTDNKLYGVAQSANYLRFYVPFPTENDFMSWMASQYSAGTPVTVLYQLATPTEEYLDYEEILASILYTSPQAHYIATGGALTADMGYLYNWCAATDDQSISCANSSSTGSNISMPNSICPASTNSLWRLPNGNSNINLNDFAWLNGLMNGETNASNNSSFYTNWLPTGVWQGTFSGYYNDVLSNQGYVGGYWSSAAGDTDSAYYLGFNNESITPNINDNKSTGYAVRCVI